MFRIRLQAALGVAATVLALTGVIVPGAQARPVSARQPVVAIDIDNFRFGVVAVEVAVGTTVTWTNRDDVPHTVASVTKVFKSPPLDTGDTFSFTFKDAGTFDYYCSMHPRMTGRIVVK